MPKIPDPQRRVIAGAPPRVNVIGAAPRAGFGTGLAQGLQQVAGSMARIHEHEREKADRSRVRSAYADLVEQRSAIEGQYKELKRHDAIGAMENGVTDFKAAYNTISDKLSPRQREMFEGYLQREIESLRYSLGRHEDKHRDVIEAESFNAVVKDRVDTLRTIAVEADGDWLGALRHELFVRKNDDGTRVSVSAFITEYLDDKEGYETGSKELRAAHDEIMDAIHKQVVAYLSELERERPMYAGRAIEYMKDHDEFRERHLKLYNSLQDDAGARKVREDVLSLFPADEAGRVKLGEDGWTPASKMEIRAQVEAKYAGADDLTRQRALDAFDEAAKMYDDAYNRRSAEAMDRADRWLGDNPNASVSSMPAQRREALREFAPRYWHQLNENEARARAAAAGGGFPTANGALVQMLIDDDNALIRMGEPEFKQLMQRWAEAGAKKSTIEAVIKRRNAVRSGEALGRDWRKDVMQLAVNLGLFPGATPSGAKAWDAQAHENFQHVTRLINDYGSRFHAREKHDPHPDEALAELLPQMLPMTANIKWGSDTTRPVSWYVEKYGIDKVLGANPEISGLAAAMGEGAVRDIQMGLARLGRPSDMDAVESHIVQKAAGREDPAVAAAIEDNKIEMRAAEIFISNVGRPPLPDEARDLNVAYKSLLATGAEEHGAKLVGLFSAARQRTVEHAEDASKELPAPVRPAGRSALDDDLERTAEMNGGPGVALARGLSPFGGSLLDSPAAEYLAGVHSRKRTEEAATAARGMVMGYGIWSNAIRPAAEHVGRSFSRAARLGVEENEEE